MSYSVVCWGICVLVVSNFLIFMICLLKFGTVPTVWYNFFHYRLWRHNYEDVSLTSLYNLVFYCIAVFLTFVEKEGEQNINWKLHWRAMQLTTTKMGMYQVRSTCYLSSIYMFFLIDSSDAWKTNTLTIFCQPGKQ